MILERRFYVYYWKQIYPDDAKVGAALRIHVAGLQERFALPWSSKSNSGKGDDAEDSGFEELHD